MQSLTPFFSRPPCGHDLNAPRRLCRLSGVNTYPLLLGLPPVPPSARPTSRVTYLAGSNQLSYVCLPKLHDETEKSQRGGKRHHSESTVNPETHGNPIDNGALHPIGKSAVPYLRRVGQI